MQEEDGVLLLPERDYVSYLKWDRGLSAQAALDEFEMVKSDTSLTTRGKHGLHNHLCIPTA